MAVNKSLNQILKSLTPVYKGQSVYSVASSDRINSIQTAIHLLTRGDNIVSGPNILKKSGEAYCVLSAQIRNQIAAGETQELPFQVVDRINPDTGALELGVISNSHLFNTEDRDVYEEPNDGWGLLSDDKLTGWFGGGIIDIGTVGDKIYLQIELAEDDQSILNIDVKFGPVGPGTDWDVYPDPIGIDNGVHGAYQHYYWQIIAEITALDQDPRPGIILTIPGTDPPDFINLTQLLFDNIVMTTGHTTLDADDSHMPLLVAIPTNWPGTDIDGNADPIPPEDNLMTPYQFGDVSDVNDYSFKMLDASSTDAGGTTHFRVLILDGDVINESDGSRHTPAGMGNDDYVLSVSDDGDEIWLVIPHDNDFNVVDPVSINTGITTPEDTDLISYVTIGQVFIDFDDTPPRLTPHNTVCGDLFFTAPADALKSTRYSFQMFDASDDTGVKVKIIDGDVIDQDMEPHTPSGMGDDAFILDIPFDGAEVYLAIIHDSDFNVLDPVTIAAGNTPDDTATIAYVTIGYVTFNTDVDPPTGDPHNSLCGDYFFEFPFEDNDYSFKIVDRSVPGQLKVLVYDGSVIDEEGQEHVPENMGEDQCILDVAGDDSIYISVQYNQASGEIIEPVQVFAGNVPDDTPGVQYIEIGYLNPTEDGQNVIPHNTTCGDYFFHMDLNDDNYSFRMVDGSETFPPGPGITRVRIFDGDVIDAIGEVVTPNGMGNDDFVIDVADGDEIWVKVPRTADNVITGLVQIEHGPSTPDDTYEFAHFTLGYVIIDGGSVFPHNSLLGDIFLEDPKETNLYSFKMIDASDAGGLKVRIIDGDVTDPMGGAVSPAGMGNDDFTIGVFDGAEIWLGFTYNTTNNQVTSAFIQVGEVASGDGIEGDMIGYVTVDDDGTLRPHNTLCGDFFFDPGLDVTDDSGNVVSNVDQINFIGAADIEHDPDDVNPNAVDVTVGTYISDDEGHESHHAWGIEFDGAVTVSDERDPDNDNIGFATVKIGEYVSDGAGTFRDTVWGMEFQNASITFEDEPNGTSFASIDVTGGMSVQGDSGFVDSVNHIQFTVASDPSAGFINVTDGGEGVAIVEIPVIPVSPGGIAVLGDDDGDTHWFATSVCP